MRYFLGGVNGAGKTTLLAGIKAAEPRFEVVRGSYALMELVGAKEHNALRAMDQDWLLVKQAELVDALVKVHKDLILDSHYVIMERGVLVRRAGEYLKRFDALLFLKASAPTILRRIEDDPRRISSLFPDGTTVEDRERLLETCLAETEREFLRLAALYNIPHLTLDAEKPTEEIVKDFLAFDREVRGPTLGSG